MPRFTLLSLITLMTAAGPASPGSAQSMNVAMIVHEVTTEVCGPWLRGGDMAGAVKAALALGYRPVGGEDREGFDPDAPPTSLMLDGRARHIGVMTLISGSRSVCSVDMAEATVARILSAADLRLEEMGFELALDRTNQTPALAVWIGEGRQAVAGPGVHSTGHALTISWRRP